MPNRTLYTWATNAYGYEYRKEELYYSWNHSPKVDGVVKLQANPMSRTLNTVKTLVVSGRHPYNTDRQAIYGQTRLHGSPPGLDDAFNAAVTNQAYARLVSDLQKGSKANLGVTVSQWKSSWAMIALRARQIRRLASKAEQDARRENRRREALRRARIRSRGRKEKVKPIQRRDFLPVGSANIFLEYAFGWVPLLQDIADAFKVLSSDVPGSFAKGVATQRRLLAPSLNPVVREDSCGLELRVTQAVFVEVDNPNAWLLNKLGLVNPLVVAWDIIPWSFAVNWFANVNQIAASMTDFYGLKTTNASTTMRWHYTEASMLQVGNTPGDWNYMTEGRVFSDVVKHRRLGLTLPQLQLRLPTPDMKLALIQLSLLTQQVNRLEYFKWKTL